MQPTDLGRPDRHARERVGASTIRARPGTATPTVNGRAIIRQAQIVLDEVERLKALAHAGPLDAAILSLPLDGGGLHWDTCSASRSS
jgi:hypothetical protein